MNTQVHTNMNGTNSSFGFALADSAVLFEAKLVVSHPDSVNDAEFELDSQHHLKDRRKVSIIVQRLTSPIHREDAKVIYGQELANVQHTVYLKPDSVIYIASIEGVAHPVHLDLPPFIEGEYDLRIALHMKTPRIAEGPLTPEQVEMVKYAQVVTVHISIVPNKAEQLNASPVWTRNHHIFDSYGRRGFILADLPRLVTRVQELIGPGPHNLIEQFSEGNLWHQLLEEGLMAVAWGITPWCYSLYSAPDMKSAAILPVDKLGVEPQQRAVYRIAPSIHQLNVLPANQLAYWPDCTEKDWPVIHIAGDGETLHMDLYVQIAESVTELHENPLPSIVLTRSPGQPEAILPLMDVVIVEESGFTLP